MKLVMTSNHRRGAQKFFKAAIAAGNVESKPVVNGDGYGEMRGK
jgi:hypothetical protein